MNSDHLDNMMDYIASQSLPMDSVVIVRHGYVILEEYPNPTVYDQDSRHDLHSATKSVSSALIGIAIEEGYIDSVNHNILDFFPNRTIANMSAWKQAITLEHLLTMTSGLEWNDSWEFGLWPSDDQVQFVLDRSMTYEPGTVWRYCSGGVHLLSAIINETAGDTNAFATEHLFDPLGISNYYWNKDPQGLPWGDAWLWMTPLDMAKFGYLYLHNGMWDGQQIVPAEWVAESTRSRWWLGGYEGYGYLWWTNNQTYKYDSYHYDACGAEGQRIFVIPEYDMVVVFTANFDTNGFFEEEDTLLHNFILLSRIPTSGDLNVDWVVDIFDLVIIATQFGRPPPPISDMRADVNKDGTVDIFDIVIVSTNYGKTG